mgnify:CR=1 FL=1
MTDLHVHILPGVDDGSPNLSTSLEMAEMAAQSGVRILAVTPHANQTGIEGVEDGYVNYVKGANVAGFMKVANAMMAQGIV